MRTAYNTLFCTSALLLGACAVEAPTAPAQLQLIFQGRSEGEIEPCG